MELTVRKWGNSAGVRLPSMLLAQLKVVLGDKLEVEVRADGLMLKPVRCHYVLKDLVAQCAVEAPMPADLTAWTAAAPMGREAW